MVNDRVRNVVVAATILLAIGLFFYGIYLLGHFPRLTEGTPYTVRLRAQNADGLLYGDPVDMNGVLVGKVSKVGLTPQMHGALVNLEIHGNINIPSNAVAYIGKTTIGAPYVTLAVPPGPPRPALPRDGRGVLAARPASNSLIPGSVITDITRMRSHFAKLSNKLSLVANDLHQLLRPQALGTVDGKGPAGGGTSMANVSALVQRLNRTVHAIHLLIGSPKLRKRVNDLVANLDYASKRLKNVLLAVQSTMRSAHEAVDAIKADAGNVGSTVAMVKTKIGRLTDRLGGVLKNLQVATSALAKDKGTAGRLLNDPRLYNGLVDLSNKVKSTVSDLHVLVKKIQQEGIQLHVHLQIAQRNGLRTGGRQWMNAGATVPAAGQSEADVLRARATAWQQRAVLRSVYERYFNETVSCFCPRAGHPAGPFGRVVEIGSGAGNFKSFFPRAIATDLLPNPWVDLAADATRLPFGDETIDHLVMQDVLHHLPYPLRFFDEAQRVLTPGGRVVLTEPYISPISRVVYGLGHPEPVRMGMPLFGPDGQETRAVVGKGAFASNQAIPTRLFFREIDRFQHRFPRLAVQQRLLRSVLVHPLSGGFSGPVLLPAFALPLAWKLEALLQPLARLLAFRLVVVVEKRPAVAKAPVMYAA